MFYKHVLGETLKCVFQFDLSNSRRAGGGGGGTSLRPGSVCETPKRLQGTCVNIRQCAELLELLKRRQEPGVTEYLRASQCGVVNREVIACCPSQQSGGGGGGGGGGGSQLRDNSLPGLDVCGLSDVANNRVVNGRPANLGEHLCAQSLTQANVHLSINVPETGPQPTFSVKTD